MPVLPPLPGFMTIGKKTPPMLVNSHHRQPAMVDCGAYVNGRREATCSDPVSALQRIRSTGNGFVWVGFHEPTYDEMAAVTETFGLHELAVEDAVHAYQRPKMDRYGKYLFFVLKTVKFEEHVTLDRQTGVVVSSGEIMIFLGRDFIITVRHGQHSELRGLRSSLEADPEQLELGPAAVLHAIADRIVDEYVTVVAEIEEDIDEMETAVFDPEQDVDIEQIYRLKREILRLRRAVAPLAAPLKALSNTPNSLVPENVREYFRDVEDHLSHVAERISTFDEMLTTLVSAALAEVANRQNQDMRKISAWAAIALVPTAIAGIYGMNFEHMPELDWQFGYPMAILLILAVCAVLYLTLRRKRWL
jgi:magnesium transporter